MDKVGRPDIDAFRAVMLREGENGRQRGFFVAFGYSHLPALIQERDHFIRLHAVIHRSNYLDFCSSKITYPSMSPI